MTQAREAARAVHGLIAVPDFGPERSEQDTDFNDMMIALGKKAVRRAIEAAVDPDQPTIWKISLPIWRRAWMNWPAFPRMSTNASERLPPGNCGMRVPVLDAAVAERRSRTNGDLYPHWEVEPWTNRLILANYWLTLPVTSGDTSPPSESGRSSPPCGQCGPGCTRVRPTVPYCWRPQPRRIAARLHCSV